PTTPDATGEQPESEIETDEAIAPPQTDDAEQSGVTEAIAPPQTDGSRDADASAEAVREKEEEPVKPGKQKPRGFLGLGKILGSVTSRSKKPDQKITSSDSPDDESEWDSPAETSAPTAGAPVPDATASETIAPSDVETREAATELEQATVPEPEAVETSEPVTEPEQATSPEPEETQAEETASQETTSESGSQSAEIKAKTDDVP
ncbi:MAG: hypothetical protein GDA48_06175, partial [Hormoscilla sp. GM102CHS1]|nr:hypothetical protein [Hormoscilla sp. GM102CHS1]